MNFINKMVFADVAEITANIFQEKIILKIIQWSFDF